MEGDDSEVQALVIDNGELVYAFIFFLLMIPHPIMKNIFFKCLTMFGISSSTMLFYLFSI